MQIYISILICIVFMDVKLYVNVLSDNCLWIIMNTLMLCKTITFQLCTHGSVALSHHRKHCYLYMAAAWRRHSAVCGFDLWQNEISGPRVTPFLPSLIWCYIKIDRKKFWDKNNCSLIKHKSSDNISGILAPTIRRGGSTQCQDSGSSK